MFVPDVDPGPSPLLPMPPDGVWTIELIQGAIAQEGVRGPKRRHNQSLKYFRHVCSNAGTTHFEVDLGAAYMNVGMIDHAGKGEFFEFDSPAVAGHFQPWSWRQCLVDLGPEGFPQAVGPGVVSMRAFARPGSYDHNMASMLRKKAQQHGISAHTPELRPLIWDFLVTRADGSQVHFHPSWKDRKPAVVYPWSSTVVERDAAVALPKTGSGGTSGPGTYRGYLRGAYQQVSSQLRLVICHYC